VALLPSRVIKVRKFFQKVRQVRRSQIRQEVCKSRQVAAPETSQKCNRAKNHHSRESLRSLRISWMILLEMLPQREKELALLVGLRHSQMMNKSGKLIFSISLRWLTRRGGKDSSLRKKESKKML